jgi:hypothetical protein
MPHPYPDLSVTRHGQWSERQLWRIGKLVADSIPKQLYGRADVAAGVFCQQKLRVSPDPTEENPNHVNVDEWPADKSAQKIIAQEISAKVTEVAILDE